LGKKLCSVVLSARICYILKLHRNKLRTRLTGLQRWNKCYWIIEWCSVSMVELNSVGIVAPSYNSESQSDMPVSKW